MVDHHGDSGQEQGMKIKIQWHRTGPHVQAIVFMGTGATLANVGRLCMLVSEWKSF